MPVVNATISAIFDEIADLLDIQGANPFRIRAYRNAARTIGELGIDVKNYASPWRTAWTARACSSKLVRSIASITSFQASPSSRESKSIWVGGVAGVAARPRDAHEVSIATSLVAHRLAGRG